MEQDLLGLGENLGFCPEEKGEPWRAVGRGGGGPVSDVHRRLMLAAAGELPGYGQGQDLTQALTCALWWRP